MIFARSTETGHEIVNWGPTINGVALGLVIGAGVLVIWRLIIRFRLSQLGWDDLCIVLGLVLSSGHSINDVISVVDFGYGKHEKDLPADIRNAGGANLGFWISQMLTKPSLCATRLSFCFLYLRVFRGITGRMRLGIKIVMALIFAYYLAAEIATLLTCIPVQRNWNKKVPGHCFDSLTFIYVNAGANIIIDLIVVALPFPVIYKLQRNRTEIAIGAIGLAIPSILMSVLRLPTLGPAVKGQKAGDTSFSVTQSTIWTVAELNVPIMACCLVVLAKPIVNIMSPMLKHIPIFASRFRTTRYGTDYGNGKTGGSRFQESQGWRRADGENTIVTIGGGRVGGNGTFGMGSKGRSGELTSDGASDESILGYQKKTFTADAGLGGTEDLEMHNLKQGHGGIMRTVAVDVDVSNRER